MAAFAVLKGTRGETLILRITTGYVRKGVGSRSADRCLSMSTMMIVYSVTLHPHYHLERSLLDVSRCQLSRITMATTKKKKKKKSKGLPLAATTTTLGLAPDMAEHSNKTLYLGQPRFLVKHSRWTARLFGASRTICR